MRTQDEIVARLKVLKSRNNHYYDLECLTLLRQLGAAEYEKSCLEAGFKPLSLDCNQAKTQEDCLKNLKLCISLHAEMLKMPGNLSASGNRLAAFIWLAGFDSDKILPFPSSAVTSDLLCHIKKETGLQ